jgi:hypothetical protein
MFLTLVLAGALSACQGSDEDPTRDDDADVTDVDASTGDTESPDVADEPDAQDEPDVQDEPDIEDEPDVDPATPGRSITRSAAGAQRTESSRFRLHTVTGPATAETMRTSRFVMRRAAP